MVFELQAEIDSLKSAGMTCDSVADIADGVAWRGELAGANLSSASFYPANLTGDTITCLYCGCPSQLPSGYICEPHLDCSQPNRYRIVPD
ncbi:hypothetical protein N9L83_01770 [Flavobacteriales bacterium]|nr:hypothetical protein [Flavobacteriales bacterium]